MPAENNEANSILLQKSSGFLPSSDEIHSGDELDEVYLCDSQLFCGNQLEEYLKSGWPPGWTGWYEPGSSPRHSNPSTPSKKAAALRYNKNQDSKMMCCFVSYNAYSTYNCPEQNHLSWP